MYVCVCFLVKKHTFERRKRDEPSSLFQRQRVDMLLTELAHKYPPKPVLASQTNATSNSSALEKTGNRCEILYRSWLTVRSFSKLLMQADLLRQVFLDGHT
jgi:hypothetical protein